MSIDNFPFVKLAYEFMYSYQKQENVKGMCIMNCKYLLELIKAKYPLQNAKAIPSIAMVVDPIEGSTGLIVHMIISMDSEQIILDPSYEVCSFKNRNYFSRISELKGLETSIKKPLVENLIQMKKSVDLINDNALIEYDDEHSLMLLRYYNKQADFTEECFRLLKNNNIEELNRKLKK
jgi:hypothetical protein